MSGWQFSCFAAMHMQQGKLKIAHIFFEVKSLMLSMPHYPGCRIWGNSTTGKDKVNLEPGFIDFGRLLCIQLFNKNGIALKIIKTKRRH